jgi:uncharacterized repeat protein (TIGR02543 family)
MYVVAYDKGEGLGISPENKSVLSGTEIVLPNQADMVAPAEKEFKGWKLADILYLPGDSYTVNENILFIAQWGKIAIKDPEPPQNPEDLQSYYIVTYDKGEGLGVSPENKLVLDGTEIVLPNQADMLAPTGKEFKGWKLADTLYLSGDSYTVNENILFIAQWEKITIEDPEPPQNPEEPQRYTIIFDSTGGSEIDNIVEAVHGTIIAKPGDPVRESYIFKGWFKDVQYVNAWDFDTDIVTHALVLYAKWRLVEFDSPSEVTNISHQFDWAHNITVYWTPPSDDDFIHVKVYENGVYREDIQRGRSSFMVSSFDVDSIIIKTADDLNNVSEGVSYVLIKETGVVRIIIKDKDGALVSGATVLGIASNKTYKSSVSDARGAAFLSYPENQEIIFLTAHASYMGLISKVDASQNYVFSFIDNTKGSILAPTGTCYIPGLSGRLNPIKDSLDRLYLYADNIAINGGLQQPVYFDVVNSLVLEDVNGTIKNVWIPFIDGNTSLINYSIK